LTPEQPNSGGFIQLESTAVHSDTVLFRTSFNKPLNRYLTTGLFYAKYDFLVETVPRPILVVPLLGFLAPLSWLTGAEIRVGDADEAFLNSLPQVAKEFKKIFPKVSFSGRIQARPVKTVSEWDPTKYCLLYSYGVDATSSLVRNLEKKPTLLTVKGTLDLPLREDQYWNRVQKRIQPFVSGLGLESHVVETNAIDMVKLESLEADFERQLGLGWWEGLAHGLFLLSLCAPLTYLDRIGNLIIASSHTERDQKPWGSSPMTDEKVRWGGVRVIHDSYDLQRVDKIRQVLVPYMKSSGNAIPLRVCIGGETVRLASDELNCGRCSKCMLTELALVISGSDAYKSGFDISPASLSALRSNLEGGKFGREVDLATWRFIKTNARNLPEEIASKHPGLRGFFAWFADWDEKPIAEGNRLVDKVAPRGSRRRNVAKALLGKNDGTPD